MEEVKKDQTKQKKEKEYDIHCPYCGSMVHLVGQQDITCPNCGGKVGYDDVKKAFAVIRVGNNGKKEFVFANLIKKWWFWVSVGAVIFTVIGIIGSTSAKTITVGLNTWASLNGYQLKVESVVNTKAFGDGTIGHYETQNNYACLLLNIRNNTSSIKIFSYSDFVMTRGSVEYRSKGTEAYWYSESRGTDYPALYLNGTVDGGLSNKYYLVFETGSPLDSSYQMTYQDGFDKIVFTF